MSRPVVLLGRTPAEDIHPCMLTLIYLLQLETGQTKQRARKKDKLRDREVQREREKGRGESKRERAKTKRERERERGREEERKRGREEERKRRETKSPATRLSEVRPLNHIRACEWRGEQVRWPCCNRLTGTVCVCVV